MKYCRLHFNVLGAIFLIVLMKPVINFAQTKAAVEILGDTTSKKGIFESLLREDILKLHLITDFKKLVKEKKKEKRYISTLSYTTKDGIAKQWEVEVRARGNQRKKICRFPPLKVYFPKEKLITAGFNKKFNDYKLVVKCKSADAYDDYVLKEYLVYKLYNLITDISFRVQLIKLTIEDKAGKQDPLITYGYIIENADELASRLNGKLLEPALLSPKSVVPKLYDRMCLFQFMIGNTDWYAYLNHNMKVVKAAAHDVPVLVPYDFDYSAIVHTNYATPNNNYPLDYLEERYFLGPCRKEGTYQPSLQLFKDKKEALLACPSQLPFLSVKAQAHMQAYLQSFFDIIENPKLTKRVILDHCGKHVKIAK